MVRNGAKRRLKVRAGRSAFLTPTARAIVPAQDPDRAGQRQERAALPDLAPLVADRNLLLAMIVDKVVRARRGGSWRRSVTAGTRH